MENILNIVNFIRACEPRHPERDMPETPREEIKLMQKYGLRGTFLVQYDAMCLDEYVNMLLPLDPEQFELGVWFEMNEEHCRDAGLEWRGRPGFSWDYHADCGFSVGYTPKERELLIDVLLDKFEQTFHRKAKSLGSWMLDAHSLAYLEKKGIVATCICRDQWGTDGYTIWGGYWNQGYYPSKFNALCPAQTKENQIKIPVLRMLGSDPVRQYDLGLSIDDGPSSCQKVSTLEPVYKESGGKPEWIEWFMRQYYNGGSLAFAYAQAGQENNFGWPAIKPGLEYQFPLFVEWAKAGKIRIETLCETGEWFLRSFDETPTTACCATEPLAPEFAQSVWYDCKDYRANLFRDDRGLRLRDLFLFDERVRERYLTEICTTHYLVYDNLPVMDGNRMSGGGTLAGAWLTSKSGERVIASEFTVSEGETSLTATFDCGRIEIREDGIKLESEHGLRFEWDKSRAEAFVGADGNSLLYRHNGTDYRLEVTRGVVADGGYPTLLPDGGVLEFKLVRV